MRYVLRRLGFFVATLWACLTINFVLPRLMPGNPALAMMARFKGRVERPGPAGPGDRLRGQQQRERHQPVLHLPRQHASPGISGLSITFFPDQVSHVVFSALPWTIGLVGVTTVLAFMPGRWWASCRRGGGGASWTASSHPFS